MKRQFAGALVLLLLVLGPAVPAAASGFAVDEQSARAMALCGAMTADTEDPSGMFYNVANGAFFQEPTFSSGTSGHASADITFDTQPTSGIATQFQQSSPNVLAHGYLVQPIKPYLKVGVAIYQPFVHQASWQNFTSLPGREISYNAEINTWDFNPSVNVRFEKGLGIGVGLIVRTSEVSLARRLQTTNPLDGVVVDFADFASDTGQEQGFGWNVGILQEVTDSFSWGFAYRSSIEVDYSGSGLLTQVATGNDNLDDLLALTNPFDQEVATRSSIEFPAVANAGVRYKPFDNLAVSVDLQWTDWSSFDQLAIDVPVFPIYSQAINTQLEDTMSYRIGAELAILGGNADLRFGFAFDEAAQPAGTVSTFLYDADRTTVAVGFGMDWLDVGLAWRKYTSRPGGQVSGSFSGESFLASVTVKKKPKLPDDLPKLP